MLKLSEKNKNLSKEEFVDVIERILYAKPGTFDFIRMLVEGGNNE